MEGNREGVREIGSGRERGRRQYDSPTHTAMMTKMIMMRIIHNLTFCHHSFFFRRGAEVLNMPALSFMSSAQAKENMCG